ncbi:MAG: family 1 glycosylhydrolase [Thermoanaerobaculaceae bacterium]|nr:family 1 glycosylhydrolase [Thermoanaerobaculaceae bacterium]
MKKTLLVWIIVSIFFLENVAQVGGKNSVTLGLYPKIGINCHIPKPEDLDLIKEAQIGWIRIDLIWNVVEPKPKQYRWDMVDRVVKNAEERNIDILAILGYCPEWAAQNGDIHDLPRDVEEWKEYVRTIVSRYKGRINYWTLWNEPNSRTFFRGSLDQFIDEVFIPGIQAAKEANPNAKIVGPDLAHLKGAKWDLWLEEILTRAGKDIDIISHHCYKSKPKKVKRNLQGVVPPWDPPAVKKILQETNCLDKPFWLTEVGFRSNKVGEKKQEEYLVNFLQMNEKMGWIDKVFIYELRDSPLEPGYGIVNNDRSPKPAFFGIKEFINKRLL